MNPDEGQNRRTEFPIPPLKAITDSWSRLKRMRELDYAQRGTGSPVQGPEFALTYADAIKSAPNDYIEVTDQVVYLPSTRNGQHGPIDMSDFTLEGEEPFGEHVETDSPSKSAWYKWTCPISGTYQFDTYGSRSPDGSGNDDFGNLDSIMTIWTTGFEEVGSNDDQGEAGSESLPDIDGNYTAVCIVSVTGGTDYFIQVGAYDPSINGVYCLNWSLLALA